MIKYVVGFLFDDMGTAVALIQKKRGPKQLIGKWNGIGGKVDEGENSHTAMVREFNEEAGVICEWTPFLNLKGTGWEVEFFKSYSSEKLCKVTTMEEEEVKVFFLNDDGLSVIDVVPNLRWIIPMAFTHIDSNVKYYEVLEKEQINIV